MRQSEVEMFTAAACHSCVKIKHAWKCVYFWARFLNAHKETSLHVDYVSQVKSIDHSQFQKVFSVLQWFHVREEEEYCLIFLLSLIKG